MGSRVGCLKSRSYAQPCARVWFCSLMAASPASFFRVLMAVYTLQMGLSLARSRPPLLLARWCSFC
ncbi:uncharacterized protein MYCFIDRAFT_182757 [Pseudocercospora fijiensis CIRAD86]|uniref:Uncharacterized protein n=1 Tax=Pseudocercospora fijiensis (strain CIRAD86) TaxID=383855 RepID=M3AF93_PSEFD|nr:uncharacterized protein MYCFIDRAFT_182757 [Pseudocercospora fijiensis CIRAD86]EME83246.1 hypothetical protein MYCFIDRAFT_182757 [Pseudocercospora fijiensis CIRAD86]